MKKDLKAFLKVKRDKTQYRPVCERLTDYKDVVYMRSSEQNQEQSSRCMDCGTPFCHWACPVGNYIPEWNDLLSRGKNEQALLLLEANNNLPEITGRLCPALCEYSCVLGLNDYPVTIREDELAIIEEGFKKGLIKANPPKVRTGKKVAVVGSGPAGLAAAAQLNRAGHKVTVYERDEKIGGILRFGIPDFKLEKEILDRRINIYKHEGIEFVTSIAVGKDHPGSKLLKDFDAVCLACGSRTPRDLIVPGRELNGVYFAMDYLMQSNRRVSGKKISDKELIDAKGKKVVVIGGGDTGSDCVGTANRQGASCVVQIELLPQPPECRPSDQQWPKFPMILKTSSSHEEGVNRQWAILTKGFIGQNNKLVKLSCVKVEFCRDEKGCSQIKEIPGSNFDIEADMAVLAMGFTGPARTDVVSELKLELDQRGNVKTGADFMTSQKGVFSCGDMRRGQSLIVWAISEGRKTANAIDSFLMGSSNLPV